MRYFERTFWAWTIVIGVSLCAAPASRAWAADSRGAEDVGRKGKKGRKAKKKTGAAKDPALAAAKKHYNKANALFDAGRFEEALAGYRAAYDEAPLSGFLINIAQCHRNLENHDEAIFFYGKYLEVEPDSEHAEGVRRLIEKMKEERRTAEKAEAARLAAEKATAEAAAEEERKKRASLEATRAAEAATAARLTAEAEATRAKALKMSRPFYQRAWFWVVVGAALAAAGGGTAAGLVLNGRLPEHDDTINCGGFPSCE